MARWSHWMSWRSESPPSYLTGNFPRQARAHFHVIRAFREGRGLVGHIPAARFQLAREEFNLLLRQDIVPVAHEIRQGTGIDDAYGMALVGRNNGVAWKYEDGSHLDA